MQTFPGNYAQIVQGPFLKTELAAPCSWRSSEDIQWRPKLSTQFKNTYSPQVVRCGPPPPQCARIRGRSCCWAAGSSRWALRLRSGRRCSGCSCRSRPPTADSCRPANTTTRGRSTGTTWNLKRTELSLSHDFMQVQVLFPWHFKNLSLKQKNNGSFVFNFSPRINVRLGNVNGAVALWCPAWRSREIQLKPGHGAILNGVLTTRTTAKVTLWPLCHLW